MRRDDGQRADALEIKSGQLLAPGAPGIPARWTSSAKSGVGTALSGVSPLWFTISHGILNEIYFPHVDSACTRDFGLAVTGPDGRFYEEKRDATHAIAMMESGIPAYLITSEARNGAWRISKRVLTDPARPTLLQEVSFIPITGSLSDYRLYALLAPHLVNAGMGNTAWVEEFEGVSMLVASGRGTSIALAASVPWGDMTAGYVGYSDGWQQLYHTGRIGQPWQRAENGNVALTGEIRLSADVPRIVLALGFGTTPARAAAHAIASLNDDFDATVASYTANWRQWQAKLIPLEGERHPSRLEPYRVSTAVLAAHRSVAPAGAVVASLSVPWGFAKGDDDLGGYHLVWPRDLVETAGGFLAAGDSHEALSILRYLRSIQQPDGHWPQNMWLDGRPYWKGIQMDECAFPILLTDALRRGGFLKEGELTSFLPMVVKAARYVVQNGPVTSQDRWEEDAGYSPFTLAVEIAALLAAADMIGEYGDPDDALFLKETADCWNDQIERWTWVSNTKLAKDCGVNGYYIRIASPDAEDAASQKHGFVPIRNRPPSASFLPAQYVISPDALALVRFGLRSADDPRITDTVKVIDAVIKRELPQGPLWYRYNGDGYGEHRDGSPFDGTGIGRPWPLLAGERAHYELAAGNREEAQRLLVAMEGCASDGGLIPEQVWDGPELPHRGLHFGHPSGSAMPLVWAHSEHIKLLRSLRDNKVFDMPPQGIERYIKRGTVANFRSWRFNRKITSMPAGKLLRIELQAPAMVHWSRDGWKTTTDSDTHENGFGLHVAELPVSDAVQGSDVVFTMYWTNTANWENADFSVRLEEPDTTGSPRSAVSK